MTPLKSVLSLKRGQLTAITHCLIPCDVLLQDDERRYVDLTTFGFFQGGVLDVKMVNFMMPSGPVYGEVSSLQMLYTVLCRGTII